MRIGFDAKRAFHTARGLGSYSRTTISYLAEHNPQDKFILFTPPLRNKKLAIWHLQFPNIEVVTPKQWWAKLFPSIWRSFYLTKEIKQHQLDLFHGLSHELPLNIESTGIKTVVTIHDLIYVKFPHFFHWIDRAIFERKFSSSIARADKVIAICNQTKQDIIEHFKADPGKIDVIYQSCNKRFFDYQENENAPILRKKLGLPDKYFFYLGALEPNKNIELLLRALAKFDSTNRPNLVIAGAPSGHLPVLQKLQKDLNLADEVLWLLSPADADLPVLFAGADAFCFPSFYEGFGIPVIEALCCGTPVITSQQGALQEAAGPGALYIDPTSLEQCVVAMKKFLDPNFNRANLLEQGLKHVQQFRADVVTTQLYGLYRDLLLGDKS